MYSDSNCLTTLMFILVIGTSIWVYFDASSIGVRKGQVQGLANMSPGGWLLACLLLWIIGFPLYISKRGEFMRINKSNTPAQIASQPIPNPHAVPSADEKKCPYCAEIIKREAVVCRFCGRDLPTADPGGTVSP